MGEGEWEKTAVKGNGGRLITCPLVLTAAASAAAAAAALPSAATSPPLDALDPIVFEVCASPEANQKRKN